MLRYAFINADGIVVNVIVGSLNEQTKAAFLRDYGILYGATRMIEVDEATPVWIGGTYTDGVFTPEPEPLPEPLPEPQPEPEI